MKNISAFKKILSFAFPILIEKTKSEKNTNLKLYLSKGILQLESGLALYSSGANYKPFVLGFNSIRNHISAIENALFLGAGLGSALAILNEKYQHFPQSILVDYDKEIIRLSNQYQFLSNKNNSKWIATDAQSFLQKNIDKFDLIALDIFQDMQHDTAIGNTIFLELLSNTLNPAGHLIINTIFFNTKEMEKYKTDLKPYFAIDIIHYSPNYIFICKHK